MTCSSMRPVRARARRRRHDRRRRGSALVLALVVGMVLLAIAAASLGTVQTEVMGARIEREVFLARLAAQSGINEALSRLKFTYVPVSGSTTTASWSRLGDGGFYYRTSYTAPYHTITCWGRVRTGSGALDQTNVAPDDPSFDPTGWTIRAMEAIVKRNKHFPNAPVYVGNGGVEKGRGGFAWTSGADPADPSTWSYLPQNDTASGVDSYMSRQLPFRVDARDHPVDFLDNTAATPAAAGTPHPYSVFASQNLVGQHNAESFFQPWTGGGSTHDPRTVTQPSLTNSSVYPSAGDAFQMDANIPDVQEFSWNLWEAYGLQTSNPDVVHLPPDSQLLGVTGGSGTVVQVGTETDPKIVFCTGALEIGSNRKLKGYGILVIRDDYHPSVGTNTTDNTPTNGSTRNKEARLEIQGSLEWTGLVIIAGWRPSIDTSNMSAGNIAKINGALFGEDSVQSGGETSLDSAQIQFYIGPSKTSNSSNGRFDVTYCRSIFEPGGFVYDLIPETSREIVCIRDL